MTQALATQPTAKESLSPLPALPEIYLLRTFDTIEDYSKWLEALLSANLPHWEILSLVGANKNLLDQRGEGEGKRI